MTSTSQPKGKQFTPHSTPTTDRTLIVSSYFKDGKFSDFTILCDGKEYHVHRCFIAPQSKYFERAFGGMFKEGAERKIELKEDQAAMVERMVHFFYNFDYDDGNDKLQPTGRTPLPEKQPMPERQPWSPRAPVPGGAPTPQRVSLPSKAPLTGKAPPKAQSSLPVHIQMYCIADKYDIPGLRKLALEKFKLAALVQRGSWSVLPQATYEINKTNLPESDASLRDEMVNAWLLNGCASDMVKSHPRAFASIMSAAPWLSMAIHSRTLQNLKYSHAAKQASCEKCKTPAFFTQGEGTVKCRKCNSDLEIKVVELMKSEVLIR
jgi:hypothetical protein